MTASTKAPATPADVDRAEPVRPAPQPIGGRVWLLVAITLVPLVVAAVRLLTSYGNGFRATWDNAINEILVRDLWTHVVLTGPFSRGNWSHPGPLFYYLSWPAYHLFGANSTAMLVDALVINGAAIVIMITIAKRWGGYALAVPVAIACGALIVRLPTEFLANPWNPYVTVLPFGAFLLAAWAATCGDRFALALAVFIGSFCVQTHIGYAPLVIPLLVWCAWRVVRDRHTFGLRALWWAAGILVVVWFPPVLEQITDDPGNLGVATNYFRNPDGAKHTITEGLRVVAAQFSSGADWLAGYRGANPYSAEPMAVTEAMPVPFLFAFFVAAIGLAYRARRRTAVYLGVALLIPVVTGVLAIAQTVGGMYEYRLRWVWVLGALATAFAVSELARLARAHLTPRWVQVVGACSVIAVGTLAAVGVSHATSIHPVRPRHAAEVEALSRQVVRNLPDGKGVVLVRTDGSFGANSDIPGLILNLERASIPVQMRYTPALERIYGAHRIYHHGPVRARLLLTADDLIEASAALPGARQIAIESDYTPTQRQAAVKRLAALRARGAKPFSREVLDTKRRIEGLAVFVVPAADY